MAVSASIRRGREAIAEHRWRDAFDALCAADASGGLDADDLLALASAAYLVGDDARATDTWTRAHHLLVEQGRSSDALRCAFRLALTLMLAGEMAPANGWLARVRRLADDGDAGETAAGYPMTLDGLMAMVGGDGTTAIELFAPALALAVRYADAELAALAAVGQGQALVQMRRHDEGGALLDEGMVAVVAGDVSPILAGILYCAVVLTCLRAFDVRRAREWTRQLDSWCARQQGLVPFRGQCLVHRSEILLADGDWPAASDEILRACDHLATSAEPVVGRAYCQRGDLCRLTGDFAEAERWYKQAGLNGHDAQPGLALLRLAQGDAGAAAAALRGVVGAAGSGQGPGAGPQRAALLGPLVEILLAAGEREAATAAAAELVEIAGTGPAPALQAEAAQAAGAVELAQGRPEPAMASLRRAWMGFQQLEMPYRSARVRVLLARACHALGDAEGAGLHAEAAAQVFERLGAAPDLESARTMRAADTGDGHALTGREREVLALVAAGGTNRGIAERLDISEHTVARHISNIFNKIGADTRTAAVADAHAHKLI